jgi:hypothetical protein
VLAARLTTTPVIAREAGQSRIPERKTEARGRGVLDTPLSRGMTTEKAPYSAGLAAGGVPVLELCEAAAFFSTMLTAMIEPS